MIIIITMIVTIVGVIIINCYVISCFLSFSLSLVVVVVIL